MNQTTGSGGAWDDIARGLLCCFLLTLAFLLVWFLFIVFARDLTYRVHTTFLDIPPESFDLIHYAGMTFAKAVGFLLFLVPYLSIRIVRRSR